MKKQEEVKAPEAPIERKPFEIARSLPMDLRCMRQVGLSLWASVHQMMQYRCDGPKTLATAEDVAAEYNYTLKAIDEFYAKAKRGWGTTKIYLIAESEGFSKQMEVSIKDKDELSLAK
jgi:hypothetical protein